MQGPPLHGDALVRELASVAGGLLGHRTMNDVIFAAGKGLWARRISLAVMQLDGEVTRMRYVNIAPEVSAQLKGISQSQGMVVPASHLDRVAAQGGGAVFIGDVRGETEKFYEKHSPGKVGDVPKYIDAAAFQKVAMQTLKIDGKLWGAFTFGSSWLTPEDMPAVSLFGLQLNAALDAAATCERLTQATRELEAVNAIATLRLDTASDTASLLERVAIATGSHASALYLYDAKSDEYVLSEPTFNVPKSVIAAFPRFRPSIEYMKRPLASHRSDFGEAQKMLEAAGLNWFGTVPLAVEGRPVGWLTMARRGEPGYTPAELATAETLGVQVNALIERARLYNQLSQRVRQLSLVNELGRAGTTLREVKPLTDRLLKLVVEALPCDASAILNVHGNELKVGGWHQRSGATLSEQVARGSLPFDESTLTGRALVYLKTLKTSVDEAPEATRLEMQAFGAKHIMAAPLVVGDRHHGALVVGRFDDTPFTDDDLKLMESCAAQASVLVEHVQLFDDLRHSYSNLEKAQAEVVRHERLAALGELAAVMAHEVRNPLGVIFNSLTSLKKRTKEDRESSLLLGIVGEEADRLNRIVGDLLDFARPYEADRAPIELEPVVASAIDAANQTVSGAVKVIAEFAHELPRFVIDGHLVRQALVNLVVNAMQAMPKGGTVTVKVSADSNKNGQSVARIEVCDEGVGISQETEKQIFQPFFTTKATGTGLGLAVVKRIVDAHHGEISVRSAINGGTTFTVTLPSGP